MEVTNEELQPAKEQPGALETTKKQEHQESSFKLNVLKFFKNFHLSLREAGNRDTTPLEKSIWLIIFASCFIYCGFLIWKSYWKWSESPAIIMLTQNDDLITEIPFPAVTVCPERKVKTAVFSYEDYKNNETNGDSSYRENLFEDLSLICNYNRNVGRGRNFTWGNETVKNIKKASVEMSQVLSSCRWKGKQRACDEIFTPILTEDGICFTFNTIGPEDLLRFENLHSDYEYMEKINRTRNQGWAIETGYPDDAPTKTYPERGSGAGAKAGLQLQLTEMEEGLDLACKKRISGFKILLHDPTELPRPSQMYTRVPAFQEVTISVTASLEFTSDGLQVFRPSRRRCYFAEERILKYFKIYTQSNCETECLTNFTYARCGCVPFGMPHGPDMAICNAGSLECIDKAGMELSTMDIEDESDNGRTNVTTEEAFRIAEVCFCLPACTLIWYETEDAQWELHEDERYSYPFVGDNTIYSSRSKVSTVVIFFKRPLYDILKRSELYGTADILASCGGLLGLFMGFSVIKIVEILYFFILTVCGRHRHKECECSSEQALQTQDPKKKY